MVRPNENLSDDELLDALGVEIPAQQTGGRTPREERIIAGFEDILRFYETHGHAPRHGETLDIFERLYATRLDCLRALPEAHDLLRSMDTYGLLDNGTDVAQTKLEALDDDALLAELGAEADAEKEGNDVTVLRHVRSPEARRLAEEIASRTPCKAFAQFKPLFEQVESELKAGLRQARTFAQNASIDEGDFFVLGGQFVYVAEVGEGMKASNGENDARLRVIYSNETESNLLRRSLQRALYKDDAGRRITGISATKSLFGEQWEAGDIESGTIYVLRSQSEHPYVVEHRELIHKIGVTGGKVETRIANAAHESTYLLADVEVVATGALQGRCRAQNYRHLCHKIIIR
ncbi:hypothetical protein AGMMS49545_21080 [Betaproteobacteria bacterium]|nr:hypothetical protein AGMMS49545_21080 [Betaproteobacteria bacterium]